MNCYLYILENKTNKYYVGITKLNLNKRLERHNRGDVCSTKFAKPWCIIYFEKYNNYKEVREREKKIKSWHGGNSFKKLLRIVAGSSNGRTVPFEGIYLSSNLSPAAVM